MSKSDPFFNHFAEHPASADRAVKNKKQPENIRPWGEYHILYEDINCKVKKIIVNPGGKLSYQYHFKRNEVWTITKGTGIFTLNGVSTICGPGDTLVIPTLAKHMIENTGKESLVFIEVQRGSYFGEDDIVRLQDAYNRA